MSKIVVSTYNSTRLACQTPNRLRVISEVNLDILDKTEIERTIFE
jgi:hypothetical protein